MAHKLFDLLNYTTPPTPNLSVWTENRTDIYVLEDLGFGVLRPYVPTENVTTDSAHVGKIADFKWCGGEDWYDLVEYIGTAAYPFARTEITPDSNYCGSFNPAGLVHITGLTATPETDIGEQDGTVTIIAATSEPDPVNYSLDNTNWYVSNVFTGLAPGEYTAYARVNVRPNPFIATSGGYRYDQEAFVIGVGKITAYGDRYRVEFNDPIGSLWEIVIGQSGYAGNVETVCGSGEPLEIIWGGSSGGRFQGIIGSEARIRLISSVNFQFLNLFTADDREYKVRVLRDKQLHWSGYLMNDVYREDYRDAAYQVEVTARDGLGTLKDMPFLLENGSPYEGDRSLMQIIFMCLKKLDLDLDLWESDSWYEQGMIVGDNYSPLTQTTQSLGLYYQKETWNCYDVLDRILKSKCASLYQAEGTWHLTQDNWVYQDEEVPTVVYPDITFDLALIGYGDQKGKARIFNVTGGDPLLGEFMVAIGEGSYVPLASLPVSPLGGVVLSGFPMGQSFIRIKRETGTVYAQREVYFELYFELIHQYYGAFRNTVTVGNMKGGETDDGYQFSKDGFLWIPYDALDLTHGGAGFHWLPEREGVIYMRWRDDPDSVVQYEYFIDMGFTARKTQPGGNLIVVTVSDIGGIQPLSAAQFNIDGKFWRSLSQFTPVDNQPGAYYMIISSEGKNVYMRYFNDDLYVVNRPIG